MSWYRKSARDLPWRRTSDPYRIWVSEIMLQQTQVDTVIPYYLRFLERFPDMRALAAASIEEVLKLWENLGVLLAGQEPSRRSGRDGQAAWGAISRRP